MHLVFYKIIENRKEEFLMGMQFDSDAVKGLQSLVSTLEDANGNVTENQSITYDKVVGYSDHFPVVTTFQWTKTTTK